MQWKLGNNSNLTTTQLKKLNMSSLLKVDYNVVVMIIEKVRANELVLNTLTYAHHKGIQRCFQILKFQCNPMLFHTLFTFPLKNIT